MTSKFAKKLINIAPNIYFTGATIGVTTSYITSLYFSYKGQSDVLDSMMIFMYGSVLSATWPITLPYVITSGIAHRNDIKDNFFNKKL
jgi:hypothetical protein